MIRIAVCSDIHCNEEAFEAVLQDIQSQHCDEILLGGDLVGRGPFGSSVLQTIRRLNIRSVRGNHEEYMLNFRENQVPRHWHTAKEWAGARWMAQEIDVHHLAWIQQLPFSLRSHLDPSVVLVHGTLHSNQKGFGAWSDKQKLQQTLQNLDGNILIGCHTHKSFLFENQNKKIINPGSVGNPMNGDPRAQYIVLEKKNAQADWKVFFRKVDYDRDKYIQRFCASPFFEEAWLMSRLLLKEIQEAKPYLVPYILWIEEKKLPRNEDFLEPFLQQYTPKKAEEE